MHLHACSCRVSSAAMANMREEFIPTALMAPTLLHWGMAEVEAIVFSALVAGFYQRGHAHACSCLYEGQFCCIGRSQRMLSLLHW
jgi:hypothetical protein